MQGTTLSAGDWWVRCRGAEGSGHLQGCRRFRSGAGVKRGAGGSLIGVCRGFKSDTRVRTLVAVMVRV